MSYASKGNVLGRFCGIVEVRRLNRLCGKKRQVHGPHVKDEERQRGRRMQQSYRYEHRGLGGHEDSRILRERLVIHESPLKGGEGPVLV